MSNGEVHFLWHFIQGSIMVPETRVRLRRAWGMCPRHTFGFLSVDASFRHGHMHGPAVLYEDLMDRASLLLSAEGPLRVRRLTRGLALRGPCLMCELGYTETSRGYATPEMMARGRDLTMIREFAETAPHWAPLVCGRCSRSTAPVRCRKHLREDLLRGRVDLSAARETVERIALGTARYSKSFRWEYRGTDTPEDRAAFLAAAAWCSGWSLWLTLVGR